MSYLTYSVFRAVLWATMWIFYAPIALGIDIAKLMTGRWLLHDSVECPTCDGEVPLLGLFECRTCGFHYYGAYFSRCELCRSVPAYIHCNHCGASILSPLV